MDFSLNTEQVAMRDMAARFAKERLAPDYMKREETNTIDRTILKEMGSLGLISAALPEEFGGMGVDCVTSGVIIEEIAGDFNMSYVQLVSWLMGQILCKYAEPDVANEWVPKLAAGEALVALGLTEPRGADAANLTLRAERKGDHYLINGEKTSISFCEQADVIVSFARTGKVEDVAKGISAFVVPMNAPGVSRARFNDVGTKIVGRGSVFFDNVKIPANHRMGEENRAFFQIMNGFDYSRALIGLQCLGAAQASLNESWEYIKERKAFGAPLAQYQGVTFPLAEADTLLTATRALCYRTLWLRDANLPHTAGSRDVQVVGAQDQLRGHHAVPADPRPLRLHHRPAAPAAHARHAGSADRRRHGADHEARDRARARRPHRGAVRAGQQQVI